MNLNCECVISCVSLKNKNKKLFIYYYCQDELKKKRVRKKTFEAFVISYL